MRLMVLIAAVAIILSADLGKLRVSAQPDGGFLDHGVAAPASRSRGAAATVDGNGRRIVVVWLYDHRQTTDLGIIDAESGKVEQIPIERHVIDAPYAVLLSRANRFYTHFGNRFFEFDPAARKFSFAGDAPHRCAMALYEDPSGVIWSASFPNGNLTSFDPKTSTLTDHGQLNKEPWSQYPRSLAVDSSGWVYTGIGNTQGLVIGFNPADGEIRKFVPDEKKSHGTGRVFSGVDGKVYANAPGWGWHMLSGGNATPSDEPAVERVPMKAGDQSSLFRDFPDGSQVVNLNIPEGRMTVEEADGTTREVEFEYESEGSLIFSLVLGPDNAIYGSTGHPLRVYRFDPVTGEFTHNPLLGGHLNAMVQERGLVFGAAYTAGVLHEYDVRKPWSIEQDAADPNPRRLAQGSPHIDRPHVLLAHPDGRHLIMGGTPGYGLTGGGMLIYDLETRTHKVLTHEDLIEDQSIHALAALPDGNLLGGTTISAGTGGQVKAKEAELFIFDMKERRIVWREVLFPEARTIMDMLTGPDGLVYGILPDSTFFVFDAENRKIVHKESLESYGPPAWTQAPRIMSLGPDERIYVLFQRAIVTIEPRTFNHRKLADSPAAINAGTVILNGRLYFTGGSHIWSYAIPNSAR